jgi:hypothetical protein
MRLRVTSLVLVPLILVLSSSARVVSDLPRGGMRRRHTMSHPWRSRSEAPATSSWLMEATAVW